jgi:ribosome-binding ATPase YchF (GTP1/OBG family)
MFSPLKTTYAEVTFVDAGGGLETAERAPFPETLANALRNVDALVHVVRAFDDPSVPPSPGSTTPAGDVETIEQELILRDLSLVERRLERLRKERGKPENALEQSQLEQAMGHLDAAKPLRDLGWTEEQRGRMRGFQFLSLKPALVVLNIGESDLGSTERAPVTGLEGYRVLPLCARVEREISSLTPPSSASSSSRWASCTRRAMSSFAAPTIC